MFFAQSKLDVARGVLRSQVLQTDTGTQISGPEFDTLHAGHTGLSHITMCSDIFAPIAGEQVLLDRIVLHMHPNPSMTYLQSAVTIPPMCLCEVRLSLCPASSNADMHVAIFFDGKRTHHDLQRCGTVFVLETNQEPVRVSMRILYNDGARYARLAGSMSITYKLE